MEQMLTLVDEINLRKTGEYESRNKCHKGSGLKHLAIQIFLFDPDYKFIFLQGRPEGKIGGGKLDAPTTHVLMGETEEIAATRCLLNEYKIQENVPLKILENGVSYFHQFPDSKCENEFLKIAYGAYNGKLERNPKEVEYILKMRTQEFASGIEKSPDKYTVWLPKAWEILVPELKEKRIL